MYWRNRIWMYVILGLLALGILTTFASNPQRMIIPLAIFAIVFLLYKFPPHRLRALFSTATKPQRPRPRKRKSHRFRVIDGNRKRDEHDKPKYH